LKGHRFHDRAASIFEPAFQGLGGAGAFGWAESQARNDECQMPAKLIFPGLREQAKERGLDGVELGDRAGLAVAGDELEGVGGAVGGGRVIVPEAFDQAPEGLGLGENQSSDFDGAADSDAGPADLEHGVD
jgi:hypothetical protein